MKTCQHPPKLRPLCPTPVLNHQSLVRLWLTPNDIAEIATALQDVYQAMTQQRTDLMHLTRLTPDQIRKQLNRVISQLPINTFDWLIHPFLVTSDELWLLKAIVHDAEVALACQMRPGSDPDAHQVAQYATITVIRARLYRPDTA